MRAEDLREYLRRWSVLEREKDRFCADRFQARGHAGTVAASFALREHGWQVVGTPTEERRGADLEHHVELKRKLDRVSRALQAR